MPTKIVNSHRAHVDANGRIVRLNRKAFAVLLESLKNEDVVITVAKRNAPAMSQRGYYEAHILPAFVKHSGHTPRYMHERLKEQILGRTDDGQTRSTKGMTEEEYSEFLSHCEVLAAEMGIRLEDPRKIVRTVEERTEGAPAWSQ